VNALAHPVAADRAGPPRAVAPADPERVARLEPQLSASTPAAPPTLALQATDLQVAENDFVTILGPSGCGKSTLLRIVAGLDRPTAGEVQLDGRRIEARAPTAAWCSRATRSFPG
jgi:ABC-type nitrate/sulfonate/bicarbonate transport system ATPase subunit